MHEFIIKTIRLEEHSGKKLSLRSVEDEGGEFP